MDFQPNTSNWLTDNNTFIPPSDENNTFIAPLNESNSIRRINKKKIKMATVFCTKCKYLIKDKHLYRVGDCYWHKTCVFCDNCAGNLVDSGYLVDKKLLCDNCYADSVYAPKCPGCNETLLSNDVTMRSLNDTYHLECFKCDICGDLINKGDEYINNEGQLICKPDDEANRNPDSMNDFDECLSQTELEILRPHSYYEKNLASVNSVTNVDGDGANQSVKVQSVPVRKKTKITPEQRIYLERYFDKNPTPSIKQRELIAKELKLKVKVIQTWFCNYRTKLKLKSNPRKSRDRTYSDDQGSSSSNRIKNENNSHCGTPEPNYQLNPQCIKSENSLGLNPNQFNGNPSFLSEMIAQNQAGAIAMNHQVLQSSHLNSINANYEHLYNPLSSAVHMQHQFPPPYYVMPPHPSFMKPTPQNEMTITDLSNSCAKSIEQSILAGFNASSTNSFNKANGSSNMD